MSVRDIVMAAAGGYGYDIAKSLRLRGSASAYLTRTPASAGNLSTWTWSGWVKRGALGSYQSVFGGGGTSPNYDALRFTDTDTLQFFTGGAATVSLVTTAVFRDPSAHYHIVLRLNTTEAISSNRVILIVNGVQQTLTGTFPNQNTTWNINSSVPHAIGATPSSGSFSFTLDGYVSEVNFVDGQSLPPSYFGWYDDNGVWQPKKLSGVSYGTNGFYLPFNDGTSTTTLGYDRSGNSNNWTTSGVSLTSGGTYDWMNDTPTNNYPTFSPLWLASPSTHQLSAGNLRLSQVGAGAVTPYASMCFTSGKYYFEVNATTVAGDCFVGVSTSTGSYGSNSTISNGVYRSTGDVYNGSSWVAYGASFTTGDVIGVAFNKDANTVTFYKNGVSQGQLSTGASSAAVASIYSGVTGNVLDLNHGQRPFAYTPPAGFQALCAKNLPVPTIANPRKHFDVATYTGNGTSLSVTGIQFQPGFVWVKGRSSTYQHNVYDINRGVLYRLETSTTNGESFNSGTLSSFNSSGFTFGDSVIGNESGSTHVSWLWKAGGAPVTNTAGSITSQVSANTAAGFSIVTFTGAGSNATVGHGLGVAPKMIVTKPRNNSDNWYVYHASVGNAAMMYLNLTNAQTSNTSIWQSTTPTGSVFSIGGGSYPNGWTEVAYCFAEVEGFSKIGSYTGNGSADGPFVYCGFRPRWVMLKNASVAAGWAIFDTSRSSYNVVDQAILADLSATEFSYPYIDIVSSGFKIRGDGTRTTINGSGNLYIFMAFAESPFQSARAR